MKGSVSLDQIISNAVSALLRHQPPHVTVQQSRFPNRLHSFPTLGSLNNVL